MVRCHQQSVLVSERHFITSEVRLRLCMSHRASPPLVMTTTLRHQGNTSHAYATSQETSTGPSSILPMISNQRNSRWITDSILGHQLSLTAQSFEIQLEGTIMLDQILAHTPQKALSVKVCVGMTCQETVKARGLDKIVALASLPVSREPSYDVCLTIRCEDKAKGLAGSNTLAKGSASL